MWFLLPFMLFLVISAYGQPGKSSVDSFRIHGDVKVTTDEPAVFNPGKTIVVFYALPNGNTTAQTMGKKIHPGDDWHFDIQHIKAQTQFIRQQLKENFVVIYMENDYKSWPLWKQKHSEFKSLIPHLVDSISLLYGSDRKVYLNGHSGGGSFIFGYLAGVSFIPGYIKRISFLDSNYGYDSSYYPLIRDWLKEVKSSVLNVFAYNDSVALLNGKPVVSATGGTWYRSHLMLSNLKKDFHFKRVLTDSMEIITSKNKRIQFYLKHNLNRGIYHTQQVELNGFIHSVLCGTNVESKLYKYYDRRAYADLIK